MKFKGTLIAVSDIERSKAFYKTLFGLDVESDFGANVVLTGGIFLQTLETWREFIGKDNISLYHNAAELYFEEDDFDAFIGKLDGIKLVHPPVEHPWGQRAVRFYDPDGHIIEVGENLAIVIRRFIDSGMTVAETAVRMDVPEEYINKMLEKSRNLRAVDLTCQRIGEGTGGHRDNGANSVRVGGTVNSYFGLYEELPDEGNSLSVP